MARTKLRIIIPLLQVLIFVLAFSLVARLSARYLGRSYYLSAICVTTLFHLVLKLNFPLVILGLPIIYLTSLALSYVSPPTGALRAVISGACVLAILTSIAAFWYFVVVEVEMRKRKTSCLRFSGQFMERLKATVMILIGVGAAVYALWDGYRQLVVLDQINRMHLFWSSFVVDTLIGGLLLIGWAAALITIGVQDMVRVSGSR